MNLQATYYLDRGCGSQQGSINITRMGNGAVSPPPRRLYILTLRKVLLWMHRRGFDDAVLLAGTELTAPILTSPTG